MVAVSPDRCRASVRLRMHSQGIIPTSASGEQPGSHAGQSITAKYTMALASNSAEFVFPHPALINAFKIANET